jgi:twinkle protein
LFDANRHIPDGIISKEDLWKALEEFNSIESIPYPPCLAGLNEKLKGMRFKQIALFISGTGSGKSTMLREIILHILQTTEYNCGVVSLEEAPEESAKLLSGMILNRNPADTEIPIEELKVGFDEVFGEDRVSLIDHGGSMNDDSIMDRLEYLCLIGCKFIFVDHVTILASEGSGSETGNEAIDKIMNNLARLAKRHDVWIGLVSHLRKSQNNTKSFEEGRLPSIDDIRGSGSIKQISYDIIAFSRDMTAELDAVRNVINTSVLKCRHTGKTGPVDGSKYDFPTGRLAFAERVNISEFSKIE